MPIDLIQLLLEEAKKKKKQVEPTLKHLASLPQQVGATADLVRQNFPKSSQEFVNRIPSTRQFAEERISQPLEQKVTKAIDKLPASNPRDKVVKEVAKFGASSLIDTLSGSSALRGMEFLTSPQRRKEVTKEGVLPTIGAGADVLGLVPFIPGSTAVKFGKKVPAELKAADDAFAFFKNNVTKRFSEISKLENALPKNATQQVSQYLENIGVPLSTQEKSVAEKIRQLVDSTAVKLGQEPGQPLSQYLNTSSQKDIYASLRDFVKESEKRIALSQLQKSQATPRIDRTKLTGKALDIPSEILQKSQEYFNARRQGLDVPYPKEVEKFFIERGKKIGRLKQEQLSQPPLTKPQPKLGQQGTSGLPVSNQSSLSRLQTPLERLQQGEDISLDQLGIRSKPNQSFDDIINRSNIDVKSKVHLMDYLRTPDRVLKKIGMEDEANLIRKKYDDYTKELPVNLDTITNWSKQVSKESNQRIFKWLDGQEILLQPDELKVAGEIKGWLANWADRLKLPQDRRISNYITHIFDRDLVEKEFDPNLARLIQDKVAGSVYDPFTQQRLGKFGYKEDTWQALDAYVKRATRKVHMDEALEQVKGKAEHLEQSQYNYIKSYVDRVNMRPTDWDNLLDNFIKATPVGYKLGSRPTTVLSRNIRQAIYRGTLGLNLGSAVKNLTQGANTYAKLGERYTIQGYSTALKHLLTGSKELEEVGVLRNDFIQDRTINATKKFWENLDKGLWFFFDTAEKINRGAAYFGGKAKALSKGATEEQAIEAAKKLVRDTQFQFGSIDTPVLLQSDMAKMLSQFQSYNVKQTEFLASLVKDKDFLGLTRYLLASMGLVYSVGQAIGMEPKDLVPTLRIGNSPFFSIAGDIKDTALNLPDKYGNEQDLGDRVKTFQRDLVPIVPGGVQLKKSGGALMELLSGGSFTDQGQLKYPSPSTGQEMIKSILFGSSNTQLGKEYREENKRPLSEKQTQMVKEDPKQYDLIQAQRRVNAIKDKIKSVQQDPKLTDEKKLEQIQKLILEGEAIITEIDGKR